MKIRSVYPQIWAKAWKMPYLATLKNPTKNSWIRIWMRVDSKIYSVLPFPWRPCSSIVFT